jgi:hypothetical protein
MAATFFVLVLGFMSSCEKSEDQIGLELQDEEDLLGISTVDTFSLVTRTILADSSRTDGLSTALLGDLVSMEYGSTKASIYTQIRPSALGPSIDASAIFDSLVLSLRYANSAALYGYQDLMNVKVYRLNEELVLDTNYFSNRVLKVESEDLVMPGSMPFLPNVEDSVVIATDTLAPQLRLRLSDLLGETLLEEARSGTAYGSFTEFYEYFNGFYITAEKAGSRGNILRFDLLSSDSRLNMYYHDDEDTLLQYNFSINENTERFLNFSHDHSGSDAQAVLDNPELGQSYDYIQSLAGLNLEITFETIQNILDNGNVSINKAQLILPADLEQDTMALGIPTRMFAVYENADGDIISIPDIFEGEAFSDGFYDDNVNAYKLNLTRYIQQLITGVIENPKIRVLPTSNSTTPSMVKVFGPDGMMEGAKLVITYTEFN